MSKILMWHQGALGDLILSLPSVHAVRHHAGKTPVDLVSRTDLSDIIIGNDLADKVISPDKGLFAPLFNHTGHMPEQLLDFLGAFSTVYIFMRFKDDIFMNNVRRYIRECFIVRSVPPAGVRTHVAAFQLDQVQAIIGEKLLKMPALELPSYNPGRCCRTPVITIHPGSGGKKKCWPLEKYLRLIELSDSPKRYQFKIILGPAEAREVYKRTRSFLSDRKINATVIMDKSVSEIAHVLKSASLHIGNDSGISHLASLLGTPVIAIFGPTDHEIWKPAGSDVVIVRSDIKCSPCLQEVCNNCQASTCLEEISPETVLETIRGLNSIIP